MSAAKVKAQQIIDENAVVVFSKSYCPYCRATKSLLNEKHAKYFLMELDQVGKSQYILHNNHLPNAQTLPATRKEPDAYLIDDGAALQDALEEITGQRSVPNIFISQQHIGGNSDLQAKKSQLDNLLKSAGAIEA